MRSGLRRRRSLWELIPLLAVTAALLGWGAWFYVDQRNAARAAIERDLAAIAKLKTEEIAAWRRDQLEDAAALLDQTFLAERIARYLREREPQIESDLRRRFSSIARQHGYADILLVDQVGAPLFSLAGAHAHHRAYLSVLAEAHELRKPLFSNVHRDAAHDAPHISVVAPIHVADAHEQALGALVLISNASDFLYPLIEAWPTPSATAETLLVRRDGDDVVFLNNLRHQPDTALKLRIPIVDTEASAVMAVLGRQGVVEGKDYRGEPVVSVLMPIPDSPWHMVAKEDAAEVYGEWRARAVTMLATLGASLCAVAALVLVLWQRRRHAYYQALYRTEAELRAAAERHSVTLRSIGDAVISTDAQGRIELMNTAAEDLTGWPEAEARGRPLEQVFRIINEETRQVVESPVEKVLREGVVVGLANHTLLLSRDGKEWPIADSGAPISDGENKIIGVVLVFRDQTAERTATEALRKCEARYRETLDGMLEGCQIISRDWRYVYINDVAEGHNRRAKAELLGNRYMDMWPGIEETEVFDRIRRCLEERVPGKMQNLFTYPDGEAGWFELRMEPVPEGVFILSMDITERKRAEEKLHHLAAVQSALRNVNQLIVREKDRDTLLHRACDILTETRGYRSAWIAVSHGPGRLRGIAQSGLGEAFVALCDAIESGEWPDCCRRAVQSRGVVVTRERGANGAQSPLLEDDRNAATFAVALRHGEREYGVLVVALPPDIAEDAQERCLFAELAGDIGYALYGIETEADHRESERTIHAMFDGIHDGILLADSETQRLLNANSTMCRMLGYSLDEIRGMSVNDLQPPESTDRVAEEFGRQARGEMALTTNRPVRRKDGTVFPADVNSTPLEMNGRRCVLSVFRDITARLRLESQLQQAQKMESVGRLAGGVAHDFNNLLMGIMGYAELCREQVPADHPIQEWLNEMTQDAQRSANLTQQLLAFARKQTIEPRIIDLNDTISGMLNLLRRMVGEDVSLAWLPAAEVWPVKVDPGQVDQMLANLAVNGRDAIAGVGKITIETGNASIDDHYCAEHVEATPGEFVMLAVSDDGSGMDRATLANIFEPFYTTKPLGEGTGLGLATVYGIVKQSDGFINVYSELGKGTTFRIYLPRHFQDVPEKVQPKATENVPGGTETILVVEDEKSVRLTTALFLQVLGYTVLTAACPGDALRQTAEYSGTIHLLITDVVMPGMSGRDLAAKLSADYVEIKCLYISGYTANVIALQGILEEGVHFLAKPFTRDALARKVREVLSGRATPQMAETVAGDRQATSRRTSAHRRPPSTDPVG